MTDLMKKRLDDLLAKGTDARFGCFGDDVAAMEIVGTDEWANGDDSQPKEFDVTVTLAGRGVLDKASIEEMLESAGYQLIGYTMDEGFFDYYYSR